MLIESWGSQRELGDHQQQPAVRTLFGEHRGELLAEDLTVHYCRPLPPTT